MVVPKVVQAAPVDAAAVPMVAPADAVVERLSDSDGPRKLQSWRFSPSRCEASNTCVNLPRHGTGSKLEGWIEPSRYVAVLVWVVWCCSRQVVSFPFGSCAPLVQAIDCFVMSFKHLIHAFFQHLCFVFGVILRDFIDTGSEIGHEVFLYVLIHATDAIIKGVVGDMFGKTYFHQDHFQCFAEQVVLLGQ